MKTIISIFKFLFLLFIVVYPTRIVSQNIAVNKQFELPKGIEYEGKIKSIIEYTDKLGDNIVIATETGIYRSNKFKHESDGADAELFAYHYLVDKKGNAVQTWRVYDFISDCPVDIEASFLKNGIQVTDLNKDGVAEVWMIYKTVCHGDVSPCTMKIIMYQGNHKYAMRGENKVFGYTDDDSKEHYIGGEYEYDKAFINGPKAFRDYAKQMWDNNVMQQWDEDQ